MLRQIALRNTIKNWRQSTSALLSLAAAFVSLVLFDGYMDNVKSIYLDNFKHRQMLGDVMIENKNLYSKEGIAEPWRFWITKEQQQEILNFIQRHSEQVQNFSKSLQFTGMITNGHQSQIFMGRAYDIENGMKMRGDSWRWNTTFGKPLDQVADHFSGLLGQGLARKLGCQFHKGKTVFSAYGGYEPVDRPFECPMNDVQLSAATSQNQLNAVDLNIPGLIDAGYKDVDDRYIQTSLEAAQTLLNTQDVTFVAMELSKTTSVEQMRALFQREIAPKAPDLQLLPWQEHRMGELYTKTMDFLSIFRNFILVVIVVVSTMSVLNTMIKIVKERTREIGTLRSLGFRAREVAIMFLYESLYLSMLGSFIGLLLAVVITLILNAIQITYKAGVLSEPVAFRINFIFFGYLTAWLLLMSVSALACYFSTLSILKSKIVDNLNHA